MKNINPYDLGDIARVRRWWHIKYGILPSVDRRYEERVKKEQDKLSTKGDTALVTKAKDG